MGEGPLSCRYIKVGDRIGLLVKRDVNLDQMTESGAMVQTVMGDRIIKVIDLGEILEEIVDKIVGKGREMKGMVTITIEIGTDQERAFVGNYRRDRSSDRDRSRSGSRTSTNRDWLRCYACREYDYFMRDCHNSREERDLEQLQHILNVEKQDHRSLSTHSSDEDCRSPLNL